MRLRLAKALPAATRRFRPEAGSRPSSAANRYISCKVAAAYNRDVKSKTVRRPFTNLIPDSLIWIKVHRHLLHKDGLPKHTRPVFQRQSLTILGTINASPQTFGIQGGAFTRLHTQFLDENPQPRFSQQYRLENDGPGYNSLKHRIRHDRVEFFPALFKFRCRRPR